jgi:hypothetical protein
MNITTVFLAVSFAFLSSVGFAQTPPIPPGTIVLDKGWQTPIQGGSATMKDLGALLSPFAQPSADISSTPRISIYQGVTYLMPYAEARQELNLIQKVVAKNRVGCAGFPKDSFSHYVFDGNFDGHFNKLYIVVDKADQVVAIQLVTESPKADQVHAPYKSTDWHCYDFVLSRTKASKRLWIDHKPSFEDKYGWHEYSATYSYGQPKGPVDVLRIDSLLMNPDLTNSGSRGTNWKPLEAVRLYLPKPMMELILYCVRAANK